MITREHYCNPVLVGLPGFPAASSSHSYTDCLHSSAPRPCYPGHVRTTLIAGCGKNNIHYKLCLPVHKALIGHAPQYIADIITPVAYLSARSSLRASHRGDLVVPQTNRKTGDRAFAVAAPRAWNQLPTHLKLQQSTTTTFSRHLKTFLCQRAFSLEILFCLCNALPVYLVRSTLEITAVTFTVTVVICVIPIVVVATDRCQVSVISPYN